MEPKDSILDGVKKVLGFDPEYTAFDPDIIMHINTAFGTLHQLGVGPEKPFIIQDKESTWDQFTTDDSIVSAKSYLWASVRLAFDPPSTSYGITALENLKKELEWRLNVAGDKERV